MSKRKGRIFTSGWKNSVPYPSKVMRGKKNGQKRSLYSLDNFVYDLRCVLEKMHLILELV